MDFVQTKAKVISDLTGANEDIPVVLTSAGVLEPLVDYLISHSHDRSMTWMNNTARATKLFMQFAQAHEVLLFSPEDLFRQFVLRLSTGTIGRDGLDASGLYWLPSSQQVCRTLVNCLTQFSSWLSDNRGAANLNPLRAASTHERAIDALAAEYRRNNAFLSHVLHEIDTSTTVSMRPLRSGASQASCHLGHAAIGCISMLPECVLTMASRSGFRVTAPIGVQSRVAPDQRCGLRARAWRYTS